ncbi:SPOPL [Cordylochernes scorpioides]|uniref:SPOPL n=1 Tax=Cordylochernes scorpioides TaxID=51811 RepID=A0ABY6KND1_9ARAC|nr:SPOPL [Cordylochernes scorpioides]
MLTHDMNEKKEKLIKIVDAEPMVFEELLRYIYTGKAPNLEGMAAKLMEAADKYGLERLKTLCEVYLGSNLTVDNAAEVLVLADMQNAQRLKSFAIYYINTHSLDVVDSQGWKDIRDDPQPMGGLVVLLAGDFRQTLPVVTRDVSAANGAIKKGCRRQNEIVFTDESRFCLQNHDGRIRVWTPWREDTKQLYIHRHTGPTPGIMVWGGIGYNFRTPLVRIACTLNSQRYFSEMLEPVVHSYLQGLPTAMFQQDIARPHVARIVQRFFVNCQVEFPPWMARSPELSPIENMCSMLFND